MQIKSIAKVMIMEIHAINSLTDNYIWAIVSGTSLTILDPGSSDAVIAFVSRHQLSLDAILVTHHHYDHTEGIPALHHKYPKARIFGPNLQKNLRDLPLNMRTENTLKMLRNVPIDVIDQTQCVNPGNIGEWQVLHTPGHTNDHICYYRPGYLFCADTLFAAGCGRVCEGNPSQLFDSLSKLAALPDNTLVYPAHEYTLANLRFAEHMEPYNPKILEFKHRVEKLLDQGKPSLPTTIGLEKQINPFLRCSLPSIQQRVREISGQDITSPREVFITLRALKDRFQ